MSYAVHYRDADGVIQLEEADSQDAALELFERLRNQDGPTELRVFHEVPVEVRTYYKVVAVDASLASEADGAPSEPPSVPSEPPSVVPATAGVPSAVGPAVASDLDVADLGAASPHPSPASTGSFADLDAPSGAVVMAPPLSNHDRSDDEPDDAAEPAHEPRRQLFGRG